MSLVFSVKQTGVPLGAALAGAIVPGLQEFTGWQPALLLVAAVCVLCAVVAQTLRVRFDADRDPQGRVSLGNFLRPVRLVLEQPALRTLAGCSFLFSIAQLSLTTYLVTYLTDSLAYGLIAAGAVLSISQVGAVWAACCGAGCRPLDRRAPHARHAGDADGRVQRRPPPAAAEWPRAW
jgi:predicted MFS family arabinose efflux permease